MAVESAQLALKLLLDELGIPHHITTQVQRKTVQKGVYLGQLAGVDLGYRYNWYVMGPYSPALTRDYFALDEAISAGDEDYATYELQEPVRQRLKNIAPILDVPEGVDLTKPDWMELIASTHYLLRVRHMSAETAKELLAREKPHVASYSDDAIKALTEYSLL